MLQNLIWLQNKLYQEGRYIDALDGLIIKFSKAERKELRIK